MRGEIVQMRPELGLKSADPAVPPPAPLSREIVGARDARESYRGESRRARRAGPTPFLGDELANIAASVRRTSLSSSSLSLSLERDKEREVSIMMTHQTLSGLNFSGRA